MSVLPVYRCVGAMSIQLCPCCQCTGVSVLSVYRCVGVDVVVELPLMSEDDLRSA